MNKNIIVFDTETISLGKRFIYNLGYVIANSETGEILEKKDLVIKEIYDNKPLFATAYFSDKRPIYTSRMKGRKTRKMTFERACQEMQKDLEKYQIKTGYAYNSNFDIKAFQFTHGYFKNATHPLDNIEVLDIMDEIDPIIRTEQFARFCIINEFMTKHKKPRPRKTAEVLYSYLTNDIEYKEEHTALEDSKIELYILMSAKQQANINEW